MIKVKIFSVGKNKEGWIDEALAVFEKRLKGKISFVYEWVKDDKSLIQTVQKEETVIALDPKGKMFSSEEFAIFFRKKCEEGGTAVSFVIGGAEGLPNLLRKKYPLVSFSKMTFTHQMARIFLVEQIYRSYTILEGIPYHK